MSTHNKFRNLSKITAVNKCHTKTCSGFTLVEIMVVITLVAVLVTLALPSYQNYVIRAQVTEGLALLGSKKTEITSFHMSNAKMPRHIEDIGWPSKNSPGRGYWNTYKNIFEQRNDIWNRVGVNSSNANAKSQYVDLYLRTNRLEVLNNKRGFLYLQAKSSSDGVEFRCSVSRVEMMPIVPSECSNIRGKFAKW